MGLNFRRRFLLREEVLKNCENCKKLYPESNMYCPECGSKLSKVKTQVYANLGKSGITSLSYKLPNGITINSKGAMTIPVGKGISYTTKSK